jgi:hypothetical protein
MLLLMAIFGLPSTIGLVYLLVDIHYGSMPPMAASSVFMLVLVSVGVHAAFEDFGDD